MVITSLNFLLFCLLAVLVFACCPKKYRWLILLAFSIAFYLICAMKVAIFMVITSFTTWGAAILMSRVQTRGEVELAADGIDKETKKNLKKRIQKRRKQILVCTLIINLGILVALKLFGLFSGAFTALINLFAGGAFDAASVVMPLGISYYTFSSIGYLLDIYWKRYEKESNFARFLLFTCYFPRILQGPISRYPSLGMELRKEKLEFKWDNFIRGMESILLGCFKKLVIADRAGIFVANTLYDSGQNGFIYLAALILDGIQIYADFSGYMDIVSGVSLMFDVKLEQNFNHPFLAKSVPEFWRRWHMTLGGWFKDYVYYPITVAPAIKKLNKKTKNWENDKLKNIAIVIIPVMVTWLLTGLWHGTGLGYVMWGLYYGTLITISVTFSESIQACLTKMHINTECIAYRIFQTIKIFVIFMGGRFLGQQIGMSQRINIIKRIFTSFPDRSLFAHGLDVKNFVIVIAGIVILIAIAVIETREDVFDWLNRRNKVVVAGVIYFLFFSIFVLGIYGAGYDTSGFMYQNF